MTNLTNIVEMLAKQALGNQQPQNNQQQNTQQPSGLGGILGVVLGQLGGQNTQANHQNTQNQGRQSGLGGVLGSVLEQFGHGNQRQQQPRQTQNEVPPNSGNNSTKTLLIAVLPLVLAWIQKQGGLQGALDKLRNAGLGNQVQNWVDPNQSNKENAPQQNIQNLFDDQEVEKVAEQTHAPKQDVYSAISSVLPQIIDALTPQGEKTNKQEANNDIQNVLNMVSGFLKR
ncbi:YidB family protein [Acinetobacter radioresistens]|uniref:YidB family protein n=1 Tax=Acinetobacter radioresistens TaxID=40216 RepID=UPI0022452485|nr:YidB family protein [Acinetobacter radioresistens]MCX0334508.1 YidB family protein [Acinetobacter radioresistens]